MAISGGDGSIILTTKVDEGGLKKGLGSMGGTVKSFAAGVAKSFAVIGAAAGAATVAITKMSVDAYADYEQLIGGVETLFKGSAQKVIDYANDAFYTAGVSANEYMQTAIGVSASLIQSLGRDTAKAADIANMAIIDMSDNVNKLGTDMERVKMAYAGFARQQYVLLDNLALGYQGTKTEMERLLRDAEAYMASQGKTVEYNINNLSDVYSAINAIQQKLGIAGTTVAEAEKTITGSANMMKAAWQNVLAAISGGGDLDRAINNLVYSVEKYFKNIVPVVERSLVGIGKLIEKIAPMLVKSVAVALIKSIPSLLNAIYQMIIGLSKGIYEGIRALISGESGSVTAEIKTEIENVSNATGEASESMNSLGDATEEAGKKAKKALAGFDDIQILSSGANSAIEDISVGEIGGLDDVSAKSTMDIKVDEMEKKQTFISEMLGQLVSAFSGLSNIDLTRLSNGALSLWDSLKKLAEIAWGEILYGIKKVITPLSKFVIEEGFPEFIDKIGDRLNGLTPILRKITDLIHGLNENFIMPLARTIWEKLLPAWQKLNDAMKDIENRLAKSDLWADLKTILDAIYKLLLPIIGILASILGWITKIATTHMWNDLKTILSDLEDIIGLIAALINFDLVDAWNHLKELLIDNRIEDAMQDFILLSDVIDDAGEKIIELVAVFKEKIDEIIEYWKPKISDWWDNDVKPWFTKEKWNTVFANISSAISTFFHERGGFLFEWHDNLKKWWTNYIEPWFTKEKWANLGTQMMNGLIEKVEAGLNRILEKFHSSNIGSIFNFAVGGIGANIPKSISIPRLATGAVLPANKPFLSIVGDQKHGTNIEAPLQTIVDAFNIALSQNGYSASHKSEVVLEMDGNVFGRAVLEQFNKENRRIGTRLVIN